MNFMLGSTENPKKLCTKESEEIGKAFTQHCKDIVQLVETNAEDDLLKILDLLEGVRSEWEKSVQNCNEYQIMVENLTEENDFLRNENECLSARLRNCQSQLSNVTNSKRDIEEELAAANRRLNRSPAQSKELYFCLAEQKTNQKRLNCMQLEWNVQPVTCGSIFILPPLQQ
jgi:regulator of replication initiation timing